MKAQAGQVNEAGAGVEGQQLQAGRGELVLEAFLGTPGGGEIFSVEVMLAPGNVENW